MKPPISLQLYTLREPASKDPIATLTRVAEFGYVGVELAGMYGRKPKEFRQIVDGLGLKISGAHIGLPDGDHANAALDEQDELGNKNLISGFGPADLSDETKVNLAIERINRAAPIVKARGMRLSLHNHDWEFAVKIKGKTVHQLLMEGTDPSILAEVDIYWVKTGGCDPQTVVKNLGKRAPLIHVKDGPCVKEKPMTAVGAGTVDVINTLKNHPFSEWHIVEMDSCATDVFQAVKESYDFLTKNGLSQGKK